MIFHVFDSGAPSNVIMKRDPCPYIPMTFATKYTGIDAHTR